MPQDLPFTHEMVIVHKMFRRIFVQGPEWIRRVPDGDVRQAAVVFTAIDATFDALHHHHEAEDQNLWPLLRERVPDRTELFDTMEGQHRGIDPALRQALTAGKQWTQTGSASSRDAFADALEAAAGPILAHLDQEEADILPLAQVNVTDQEWGRLAQHVLKTTPKKDLIKGLGAVLEDADARERELMLSVVPAVPKLLYALFGKRAYIKEAAAVRGVAPTGL
jgi:hemerythrin-like domain-containing protein